MLAHMETQDDHIGGQKEFASAERRPQSVKEIQDALKRVSLSHSNRQYKENIFLNGSSNATQTSDIQLTQNGCLKSVNPFLNPVQTTASGFSPTSANPFLTQDKDSNKDTVSRDNNKDLMLRHGQSNGWTYLPTSSAPSLENDCAVSPPPTLSQETNQATFHSQTWDIFQNSNSARISPTGLSNQQTNIFEPFKEETSVSQRMVDNEKTSEYTDSLLERILANQKNDEEPIPSPTASSQLDVLQNMPSFLPTPVINDDIFTNTAASQSNDIVQTPEFSAQSTVFQMTQLLQTPASVQNNNSHLSGNSTVNNGLLKPQDIHFDKMFTPTKPSHGIFQETSTLPSPLNVSTNGEMLFRRRPPKPTPRSKPPKNPNKGIKDDIPAVAVPADQKPAQTLFTSTMASPMSLPAVTQPTTNIQDTVLTDEVNQSQVYEDILFIGQEKCVEDWPEDSPELNPNWKPCEMKLLHQKAGKLKLRRESLRIALESEAAQNADVLGKKSNKTKKKLRLSKRGSKDKSADDARALQIDTVLREPKEKYPDGLNDVYGNTLPWGTKFHASDDSFLSEQEDQTARMKSKSVKSKKTKFIVPRLQNRGARTKSFDEGFENESMFLQASKSELFQESHEDKLSNSEQEEPVMKDCRPKEPWKFKSHPSHLRYKDATEDDLKKPNGLSFSKGSKEDMSVRAENENRHFSADLLAEYQHESFSSKSSHSSGKMQDLQDDQPKRPIKFKIPHSSRKGSKSTLENDIPQKGADLFKASDIKGLEMNGSGDYSQMRKPPVQRISPSIQEDSKGLNDAKKGADLFKAGDIEDDNWTEKHDLDSKADKLKKAKEQVFVPEDIEPPGATSGDYYLSEAAKAEWMSSQMDVRRARVPDGKEELEDLKEEEEGDTDSLMEWWNTVELWDELPSDEEVSIKENETKSFTEIADKVHNGLRVFYKVFTEQAEFLYQHVLSLYAISDNLSNFHRRAKIASITGGTTTAVGGVAAIAGLALAPITFGASLIVSAVGLGVATAGGITAASATISDNVHDMNDRKKIEVVVQDYETRLAELRRCLHFVAEGVYRLRFHPLLRRNNYYAGDWEVRRALQTISLVGEPVEQAQDVVEKSTTALNSVCKSMDNYFSKDSKELKVGCKKEVTTHVNMLAKLLHDGLVELNSLRDQLMEAIGHN